MSKAGKILLGGGEVEDEYLLFKKLAGWVGPAGKLLYWPVAFQDIGTHEPGLQRLTETFKPLNVRDITMWSHLADHNRAELDAYTAVFISGGMRSPGYDPAYIFDGSGRYPL